MSPTPRIRPDLQAQPAEEQGIKYFDVSDPRSGARMRLYDFEWLIAERMDGRRPFDEVASWAHERLGIQPTAADLTEYANRLKDLGFFELSSDTIREEDRTPLPPPMPGEQASGVRATDGPGDIAIENEADDGPTNVMPLETRKPEPTPTPAPTPAPVVTAPVVTAPASSGVDEPRAPTGKVEAHREPAKGGSSATMIGLVIVVLAIAGVAAYMKFGKPQSTHVTVQLASPREVVRLFDGAGAVKKTEAQALTFGEAGKVTDVVAKGTEAKPGMPLATLESYAAVEKALADVKDRLGFYEKQLAAAKTKGVESEIAKADAKVAEKRKLFADLETRAGKVRLVSPSSATVTEVLVTAGGEVKAGDSAVRLGDKRLTAEFKVPAGEAPKSGDNVTLQPAAGGATLHGRVTRSEGGAVTVELPDDAAVKTGDQLRLVKKKEQNVIPVPVNAVVKRDSADVVFVLSDGEAKMRKVTVVDRANNEALISSGLATGDSVITSGADSLAEGQKVSTN